MGFKDIPLDLLPPEVFAEPSREFHLPALQEIQDARAIASLRYFVEYLWETVETEPFQGNWHIDSISDHLEAVLNGSIRRLMINMPPRHMKSLMVSVFFPAWAWLHFPTLRFLFASYAHSLALRDSVKCRRIIQSPKYARLMAAKFPGFALEGDQNQKERYQNNFGGVRLCAAVEGIMGEGGDIIVVDDPHNVQEAESEVQREGTNLWWDEGMSTRLNNPKTGAYVLMGQRTHERDLFGHVLSKPNAGTDWDHLCLPARYEGFDRVVSSLDFHDPRTRDGEALWADRYGDAQLLVLESDLGVYATASQLQQRPAPRGGGEFPVEQFQIVTYIRSDDIEDSVRYWDTAGTTKKYSAFTSGVLMLKMKTGRFIVADVVRGKWTKVRREAIIKQTAVLDGKRVRSYIEQQPGSSGKEVVEESIARLAGHRVYGDRVTGSKEDRAVNYAVQVKAGNVDLLSADWNRPFIAEHGTWPNGTFKDQVDSSSGAFNKLVGKRKTARVWGKRVASPSRLRNLGRIRR